MQMINGFYVVRSQSKIPRKAFDLLFDYHKDLISLSTLKRDDDFGDWWYYLETSPLLDGPLLASFAFALGQMVERYDTEARKAKQKE